LRFVFRERFGGDVERGGFEKPFGSSILGEQRGDLLAQSLVVRQASSRNACRRSDSAPEPIR